MSRVGGYCLSIPTTSMIGDYEEDLDDFPVENKDRPSLVGAYRAESTDQWTAGSGITTKIPPLFDGSTSWLKYEELIFDWLDPTVIGAEKRGPALKNRLVGDAEMYKGQLDRELLRAIDGVNVETPTSSKELRVCSSGDFIISPKEEEETSRWSSGSANYHCF